MSREKGLQFVREVKKLLQAMGHEVEGPGYATKWFGGKVNAVHQDFFGVYDLFSYFGGRYIGHQVSTLANKSKKIKAIQECGHTGWVWCRFDHSRRVGYRIFFTSPTEVTEGEVIWLGQGIRKGGNIDG